MADKNFTQFDLRSPLIETDFLVGYKAGGSSELRTTVRDILDLVPTPVLNIPSELFVNTLQANTISTSNLSFVNQDLLNGGSTPPTVNKYLEIKVNDTTYWLPLFIPTSFLYSLTGPDNEDTQQKITIYGNLTDTIYFNNWDYNTNIYTSTIIYVNGVERANVSHTIDRVGSEFGYSVAGGSEVFIGTFTGEKVFF